MQFKTSFLFSGEGMQLQLSFFWSEYAAFNNSPFQTGTARTVNGRLKKHQAHAW